MREYLRDAGRYALDQVVRSPFEEREREQALREIDAIRALLATIEGIVRGDS